jgi:hypothetical protein
MIVYGQYFINNNTLFLKNSPQTKILESGSSIALEQSRNSRALRINEESPGLNMIALIISSKQERENNVSKRSKRRN